ncbi:MAG: hypothetical protein ABF289_20185 [Clostridiales bacterium]
MSRKILNLTLNKIITIVIIFIVISNIIAAILTRFSYTDYTEDYKTFKKLKESYYSEAVFFRKELEASNFSEFASVEKETKNNLTYDYEFLFKESDIVVSALKVNEDQKRFSTLSKMKISTINKGKSLIKDEYIFLYEPYYLYFEDKTFRNIDGYIPMMKNEEYFLFLKRKYEDNEYRNDEQNNMFVLTTRDSFSKYPIGNLNLFVVNKPYTVIDIEDYDLAVESINSDIINEYKPIYNKINENINNQ